MTSACIFRDTLRNHSQIFLEFKNSILRFVYISFNFNCTLDFLPSIDAEQRRGNIKGNPASGKWTIIITILVTLPIFIYWNQLLRSDKYPSKFLHLLRWHSIYHSTRLTLMFFMWSNRQMTKAYPDPLRRLSLTPQRYQVMIPEKWSLYHQLHCLNHRLWRLMMIQMSLQCLMVLDGSSRSFPQVWTIWTCRPIPLISWRRWQSQASLRRPMMTTIAHNHLTRQNSPQYRRPQWTWAPSTAGRRSTRRRTTTHFTQVTNPERYISFLRIPHRRHHLREGKKKLSLGMSFPKKGGVSQHVCEACGQTIPSANDIPGPSRRK